MKKIILSLFIIAALCCSALALAACDETTEVFKPSTGGLVYELTEDGESFVVTDFNRDAGIKHVVIPATFLGKPVIAIGADVFYDTDIKSVKIGENVIAIGEFAFNSCPELVRVVIPASVKIIGYAAFGDCPKLSGIDLPEGLEVIDDFAFAKTGITSVTVPSGVKTIGGSAFQSCPLLETLCLSEGVERVGDFTFYRCSSLKSVSLPESMKELGFAAFFDCGALSEVELNEGLEVLNEWAISYTAIKSITIPASVKSIGGSAFQECYELEEVIFNSGLEEICQFAFLGDPIKSIDIPETVTTIGESAFSTCLEMKEVLIPATVTEIGDYSFGYYYNEESEDDDYIDGFIIYGYEGSSAEAYAEENELTFYTYSAYVPSEEGNFWHYDGGEIVPWTVSVEHYTAVDFTGKTQLGRSLDYDFDEEDEKNISELMKETDAIIQAGEDYDALAENIEELLSLEKMLKTAKDYCDYEFYIYGTAEIRERLDRLNNLSVELDKWQEGLYKDIYNSAFKSIYFEGLSDEDIEASFLDDKPEEYYEYQSQINNIKSEYSMLDSRDLSNFDRIEELYVEFVKCEQYMAKYKGYDNYLEYVYPKMYYRKYDVSLTDGFFDLVVQYVVPAYYEVKKDFEADYDALSESDKEIVEDYMNGDAFLRGFDEIYSYVKTIGGTFEEAFEGLWKEDGAFLISYDNIIGAFTYVLPVSYEPCVFFSKKYHQKTTVVHEFGHYFDALTSRTLDYDLAETQSQGNELLYLAYLTSSGFYSDDVLKVITESKLEAFLNGIIRCAAVNEFEKMVYYDDDFTFGEARGYVDAITEKIGMDNDFGLWNYWHIVVLDHPGYYISYATSLVGAVNLYMLAGADFDTAVETYMNLFAYREYGVSDNLRAVYAFAGLLDIFDEETYIAVFGNFFDEE